MPLCYEFLIIFLTACTLHVALAATHAGIILSEGSQVSKGKGKTEGSPSRDRRKQVYSHSEKKKFLDEIAELLGGKTLYPLQPYDTPKSNASQSPLTVCIRKRPLNDAEKARNEVDAVRVVTADGLVIFKNDKSDLSNRLLQHRAFKFDYVFDEKADNAMVYKFTAEPLIRTAFDKGMVTIIAYGQTGSGKTYTMGGFLGNGVEEKGSRDSRTGIFGLATRDVFNYLKSPEYSQLKLKVKVSFFQLYNEEFQDVLDNNKIIKPWDNGNGKVILDNLTQVPVHKEQDVYNIIKGCSEKRATGETYMNKDSSRSHAFFQISLFTNKGKFHGNLLLIDLAGNERGSTAEINSKKDKETQSINKSLLAFKECMRNYNKIGYKTYRNSKLTYILQNSFKHTNHRFCVLGTLNSDLSSSISSEDSLQYLNEFKSYPVSVESLLSTPPPPARKDYKSPEMNPSEESQHNNALQLQPEKSVLVPAGNLLQEMPPQAKKNADMQKTRPSKKMRRNSSKGTNRGSSVKDVSQKSIKDEEVEKRISSENSHHNQSKERFQSWEYEAPEEKQPLNSSKNGGAKSPEMKMKAPIGGRTSPPMEIEELLQKGEVEMELPPIPEFRIVPNIQPPESSKAHYKMMLYILRMAHNLKTTTDDFHKAVSIFGNPPFTVQEDVDKMIYQADEYFKKVTFTYNSFRDEISRQGFELQDSPSPNPNVGAKKNVCAASKPKSFLSVCASKGDIANVFKPSKMRKNANL